MASDFNINDLLLHKKRLFNSFSIKTIEEFIELIQNKQKTIVNLNIPRQKVQSLKNLSPVKIGCILLRDMILDELNKLKNENEDELSDISLENLEKQVKYFSSKKFIDNFMKSLPDRTSINDATYNNYKHGYSSYFNTLFNVKYSGKDKSWRKIFENLKPVTQCSKTIGNATKIKKSIKKGGSKGKSKTNNKGNKNLKPKKNIAKKDKVKKETTYVAQYNGNLTCYICGKKILDIHDTMECEHVLPIITALSHWTLCNEDWTDLSEKTKEIIKNEYKWSHRCCNQIKSDRNLIFLNGATAPYYIFDEKMLDTMLGDINTSIEYDCEKLDRPINIDDQKKSLKNILRPILKVINENIKLIYNSEDKSKNEMYELFCKWKVISTCFNESFIKNVILMGDNKLKIKSKKRSGSRKKKNKNKKKKKKKKKLTKKIKSGTVYTSREGNLYLKNFLDVFISENPEKQIEDILNFLKNVNLKYDQIFISDYKLPSERNLYEKNDIIYLLDPSEEKVILSEKVKPVKMKRLDDKGEIEGRKKLKYIQNEQIVPNKTMFSIED